MTAHGCGQLDNAVLENAGKCGNIWKTLRVDLDGKREQTNQSPRGSGLFTYRRRPHTRRLSVTRGVVGL